MARLPKNLILTQAEVSQRFDLSDIAGVELIDQDDLKNAIGQAIIDKMVERSEKGKDLRGNSLEKYKKSYKQSDQYEAFGKSSKVNMTLSGGMLSRMDILDSTGNEIKIGWDDSTENAKAFNHMTGDTVTKRQFFGMSASAVKEVIEDFQSEIDDIKESERESRAVSGLLGELGAISTSTGAQTESTTIISLEDLFGEG